MLQTFYVCGIRFLTFPFIIFGAFIICVLTYMLSPIYKRLYQIIVFKMCPTIFVFAALGARLFYAISVLPTSGQSFAYTLLSGGAVFYGGMIGGAIGLLIICVNKRYEFFAFSDLFVTLLPIGHAIGRLGCYCNGCCYGRQYSGILAINYTIEGVNTTVFPTWFVEAFFCLLLFVYFQCIHKNNTIGNRTAIYFVVYSSYRFFIEYMRGDEIRGYIGVLSFSQTISIFIFLIGLGILRVSHKDNCDNYLFCK